MLEFESYFDSVSGEVVDMVLLRRTELPTGCSTGKLDFGIDFNYNIDCTAPVSDIRFL